MIIFDCKFLDKIKFRISTSSVFHYNVTDFFRFKVSLISFDVVDYKGNLSESREKSFAKGDEKLLDELLVHDGLFFGDVAFHEVHERALIKRDLPAANNPKAEITGFISIIFITH